VTWSGSATAFADASDEAFSAAAGAPESYADFKATSSAAVERAVAELNAHLVRKGAHCQCCSAVHWRVQHHAGVQYHQTLSSRAVAGELLMHIII
jgi:uncharacterized protein with PIN domain